MVTAADFMKEYYIGRLKDGWTLPDIDNSDVAYFIDLMNYAAKSEQKQQTGYIDDIF